MPMQDEARKKVAVFIDADNVSSAAAKNVFAAVCRLGEPIVRRAYGTPQCFLAEDGWQKAQREFGVLSRPQVSNLKGKNAADIALVIDAMECLYRQPVDAICIVSNDSDYTALATKIREEGKLVYGLGKAQTPISFRSACTQYIVLPKTAKVKKSGDSLPKDLPCPRCGGVLQQGWTRSRKVCKSCLSCGGMSAKLQLLRTSFDEASCTAILACAQKHEQPGCVCPDCGSVMSLVKVAKGKKSVEIDVCPKCRTVWYDKDEFMALVPTDGLLSATVSAGKSYRREVVAQLTADLRSRRIAPKNVGVLRSILKGTYHAPVPDIKAIVESLRCQKVITLGKDGELAVLDAARPPIARTGTNAV